MVPRVAVLSRCFHFVCLVLLQSTCFSTVQPGSRELPREFVPALTSWEGSGDSDYQSDAEADHSGLFESGDGQEVGYAAYFDPRADLNDIYEVSMGTEKPGGKSNLGVVHKNTRLVHDYGADKSSRDTVDSFLKVVEEYERNKGNCTPGVTFNLGEGVITQYGVVRFHDQAMVAVSRANLLTRIWKETPEELLRSEYFFYTQVRSMVEGDEQLFAAGNCYDAFEFNNYSLFCPYGFRLPNNKSEILVKDLSVEYKYLGEESEFFYIPRMKAKDKLSRPYNKLLGECIVTVTKDGQFVENSSVGG